MRAALNVFTQRTYLASRLRQGGGRRALRLGDVFALSKLAAVPVPQHIYFAGHLQTVGLLQCTADVSASLPSKRRWAMRSIDTVVGLFSSTSRVKG